MNDIETIRYIRATLFHLCKPLDSYGFPENYLKPLDSYEFPENFLHEVKTNKRKNALIQQCKKQNKSILEKLRKDELMSIALLHDLYCYNLEKKQLESRRVGFITPLPCNNKN